MLTKIGLNDQKFQADSKNMYINIIPDIWCHRMTSDVITCHVMSYNDIICQKVHWNMFLESAIDLYSIKTIMNQIWDCSRKGKKSTPFGFWPFFSDLFEGLWPRELFLLESYRLLVFTSLQVLVTILLPLKGLKQLNKNCIPSPYPMFYDLL